MSDGKSSRAADADAAFAERLSEALGDPVLAWCLGQSEAIRGEGGIPMGLGGAFLARLFVRKALDPVGGLPAQLILAVTPDKVHVFPRPWKNRPATVSLDREGLKVQTRSGARLRVVILLTPAGAEKPYKVLGVRSRGGALQRVLDELGVPAD
jgi:hypothetical protein